MQPTKLEFDVNLSKKDMIRLCGFNNAFSYHIWNAKVKLKLWLANKFGIITKGVTTERDVWRDHDRQA